MFRLTLLCSTTHRHVSSTPIKANRSRGSSRPRGLFVVVAVTRKLVSGLQPLQRWKSRTLQPIIQVRQLRLVLHRISHKLLVGVGSPHTQTTQQATLALEQAEAGLGLDGTCLIHYLQLTWKKGGLSVFFAWGAGLTTFAVIGVTTPSPA